METAIGPRERINIAAKRVDDAKESYEKRVKEALTAAEAAKDRYERRVELCRRGVEDASAPYDGQVMTVGPIVLYGNRVEYNGETLQLDNSLDISISTSGNVYSETKVSGGGPSVGGAIVGGVLAGEAGAIVGGTKKVTTSTETHDARALYVSFVSDEGSMVASVDPKLEHEARDLAAKAKYLTRTLEKRKGLVQEAVDKAKEQLDEAIRDTEEANSFKEKYEETKSDTSEVDKAQAEYESIKQSIDPSEIRAEERAVAKKRLSGAMQVIKIVLALFLIPLGLEFWLESPQSAVGGIISFLIVDALFVSIVHHNKVQKTM